MLANRSTLPQPRSVGDAECLLRGAEDLACTILVRGPGRGCRFLRLGAFHIPVMVLSALPTGCPTDFGDNVASVVWLGIHGVKNTSAGFALAVSPGNFVFAGYADAHFCHGDGLPFTAMLDPEDGARFGVLEFGFHTGVSCGMGSSQRFTLLPLGPVVQRGAWIRHLRFSSRSSPLVLGTLRWSSVAISWAVFGPLRRLCRTRSPSCLSSLLMRKILKNRCPAGNAWNGLLCEVFGGYLRSQRVMQDGNGATLWPFRRFKK